MSPRAGEAIGKWDGGVGRTFALSGARAGALSRNCSVKISSFFPYGCGWTWQERNRGGFSWLSRDRAGFSDVVTGYVS